MISPEISHTGILTWMKPDFNLKCLFILEEKPVHIITNKKIMVTFVMEFQEKQNRFIK